ncbi:HNH endonuclease signature motif containing protein [Serratia rubidaea]|uniref:HNH endonuclease n=1 Tax=Serratia rubidaea TaxID=61652 RepID=UPI0023B16473|nr:HNH endonuclease signature motif containing protein [Serratia rubidaea]MDK1704637.1 HNH endonuclease signature motif containing protein [Serratia rubidaea]
MTATRRWTREELLLAFTLYSQIPFGKLHSKNPEIIHYAKQIGRTPSALAMKLVNLASLDPFITESGRSGLKGASNADRELWQEMRQDPEAFNQHCHQATAHLAGLNTTAADTDIKDFTGNERLAMVRTRIDQNLFRKNVLAVYEYRCCLTGLEEPALLIASHIRPWKDAVEHRLNPNNGLCLSNLHDKAFDRGFITFNEHLELMLSPQLKKLKSSAYRDNFEKYEGQAIRMPTSSPPNAEHMAYHRKNIFLGAA